METNNSCVYILPYKADIFNRTFKPTEIYEIRPYCKRVTVWIEPIDKPVRSLEGLSCNIGTLGEQFAKLKNAAKLFSSFPVIDEMFYFLLGTQRITFYCENSEGKIFNVETNFEPIKSSEWEQ